MRFTSLAFLAVAAFETTAKPVEIAERAAPTLYLAGDSTMARSNGGVIDGWGPYISRYLNIPVVNKAIGGRSARSYTNEGRFAEIENMVKPGDIVVIEFGHNDGGSPNGANDNGRSDCPGTGSETCRSGKTGELVYTFNHYVETATRSYMAKGATVIISSQTPNNVWETGAFLPSPPRFVGYAALAAQRVGSGTTFVDHFEATAKAYWRIGRDATNSLYPNDHTHTSPAGADLVARAFAQAIDFAMNGTTPLKPYVKGGYPKAW
ncbi:hypothetical protein DL764_009723 [Monosporascus ibericus]|uniref:Uncharacterized protein n=1 Tax=Monosporascus ibericus TaxID=155417 RepID=A0A4Q4SX51_9PEZI|nr:hypothetical protein DL764_009723 [Monosporascus ibericus]